MRGLAIEGRVYLRNLKHVTDSSEACLSSIAALLRCDVGRLYCI